MQNTKPFALMQHDRHDARIRELRDSEFAIVAGGIPKSCATLTSECSGDYCDTSDDHPGG